MCSLRRSNECAICLAAYQHPKVLSCSHTFCQQCIKIFLDNDRNDTIKCPLCRQPTSVPKGVEDLDDLIRGSDQNDLQDEQDRCGFCYNGAIAEFRCRDCEENLCLDCKKQHMRMKQTKSHALEVFEEKKNTTAVGTCRFHNLSEMKYFCLRCGTICCETGFSLNHNRHPVKPSSEVAEEKKNVFNKYIEEMEKHFTAVVTDISEMLVEQDILNTLLEEKNVAIDSVAARLKRSVDEATEVLKSNMNETGQTLKQNIQTSLKTSESKAKSVISKIQSTIDILNEASVKDFLSFESDIISQLEEEARKAKVKDIRVTYLSSSDIQDTLLNTARDRSGTNRKDLLHPLMLNNVMRCFEIKGDKISAIACLDNGAIVVCKEQSRRLNVLGTSGEGFGSFIMPFNVRSMVQDEADSLVVTELNGSRVASLGLYTERLDVKNMPGYVQGVSLTRSRDGLLFCCNDSKTNNKRSLANGRILITDRLLEVQMQVNVKSGRDIIRFAVQKATGDFIAMTAHTCYILSGTGSLKSSFNFEGEAQAAGIDETDNLIVVQDVQGSMKVTMYDSNTEVKKDLITLSNSSVNGKGCMALGSQGDVWFGFCNRVQCIKYTL